LLRRFFVYRKHSLADFITNIERKWFKITAELYVFVSAIPRNRPRKLWRVIIVIRISPVLF
jgi:hypothetical protein